MGNPWKMRSKRPWERVTETCECCGAPATFQARLTVKHGDLAGTVDYGGPRVVVCDEHRREAQNALYRVRPGTISWPIRQRWRDWVKRWYDAW